MSKRSDTSIQAAGRTLSARNVTRLKTAWTEIGAVLLDAGVIDQGVLADLREGDEVEEEVKAASADLVEDAPEVEEPVVKEEIAAAKPNDFIRKVKLQNWSTQLRTTLKLFGDRCETLCAAPDEQLTRTMGEEVDRESAIVQLRSDLGSLLIELSRNHPGAAEPVPYYTPASYMAMANDNSAQPTESGEVAAAKDDFISQAKRSSWHTRLETTLRFFRNQFELLHLCPDDELVRQVGVEVSRTGAIAQLQDDLMALLIELHSDHPGIQEGNFYSGGYFELAKADEQPAEEQPLNDNPEKINASAEGASQRLTLSCSTVTIQLNAAKTGTRSGKNRRSFEGVLFLVDEASESAPSVGPKLPLYIPRAVGEKALQACAGLPLDADDSLGKHANQEIAGVMMSSEMVGNEARVQGLLYDWSQGEKVSSIAANKHNLGMSMNAEATGHETTVGNQKVFWIDNLDLMGGNILYANRATYQKTRVLHAGTTDASDEEPDEDFADGEAIAAANDLDDELDSPENSLEETEAEAMTHLELQASVLNANLQSLLSQLITT